MIHPTRSGFLENCDDRKASFLNFDFQVDSLVRQIVLLSWGRHAEIKHHRPRLKVVDVGNVLGRFGGCSDPLEPPCGIFIIHHCIVRAIPAGGRSGNDENTTATSRESSTGDHSVARCLIIWGCASKILVDMFPVSRFHRNQKVRLNIVDSMVDSHPLYDA